MFPDTVTHLMESTFGHIHITGDREEVRMKRLSYMENLFAAFVVLILVAGCSGGGGSSGSSGTGTYSGLTTPVTLTEENAQEVLEQAYYGGIAGSGIASPLSAADAGRVEAEGTAHSRHFALLIKDIIDKVGEQTVASIPRYLSAIQTEPISETGECGGTLTGSIQIDDVTGSVAGSFRFRNYCEMGAISNGNVSLTGEMDLDTGEISITMTFANVSEVIEDEGMSIVMSGTAFVEITDLSMSMVMDIFMQDNTSGNSYLMEDYTFTIVEYDYTSEVQVSGRFYCSDYGYVVLSTEEEILISDYDDYPMQGVFVADGADNTSARLTFESAATYRIEVDEDGDGFYEYDSGILYWDD